jgi:pteridine reductase
VLERASELDVLVHNAGLFEKLAFEAIDADRYRRMQAVNVEAPFFLTQALLPALRAASGVVIHLTDIGGERPIPGYAHYSVSKAALIMLTRALAAELAPSVRVNAVSPGTVIFPEDFDEATRAAFLARIPLGREGDGADVAKAVLFLVRDAPYVTGQVLAVDGGRSSVL